MNEYICRYVYVSNFILTDVIIRSLRQSITISQTPIDRAPIWRHPNLASMKLREQKFLIIQRFDLQRHSTHFHKLR